MPTTITGSGTINGLVLPTDSLKSGMVLIAEQSFSGVSSVSVNNCFTETYDNYRLIIDHTNSDNADRIFGLRLRSSGSDVTSGYGSAVRGWDLYTSSASFSDGYQASDRIHLGTVNVNIRGAVSIDVVAPRLPRWTAFEGFVRGDVLGVRSYGGIVVGNLANTGAYDGLTLFPSAGTITGTLRIYGYRNSL